MIWQDLGVAVNSAPYKPKKNNPGNLIRETLHNKTKYIKHQLVTLIYTVSGINVIYKKKNYKDYKGALTMIRHTYSCHHGVREVVTMYRSRWAINVRPPWDP